MMKRCVFRTVVGGHRPPLQTALLGTVLLVLSFGLAFLPVAAQSAPAANGVAQSLPVATLHIGKATMQAQIAATMEQREIGLMYVTKLGDNDGMIFLMGKVAPVTFWMKNTLIPLSVAYIDKDGVILEIHDMLPADPTLPDDALPVTRSASDQVAFALETNIHWFGLNGIKAGDKIDPPPATLIKTATP